MIAFLFLKYLYSLLVVVGVFLRRFIPDDGWVVGFFFSVGPCYVPYNDKVKRG